MSGRQGFCEFLVIVSLSFRLSFETPGWIKRICQTMNVGNSSGNSYVCIYLYNYIYIYTVLTAKACGCRGNRKAQTPKGTGERVKPRAPTLFSCRKAKRCSFSLSSAFLERIVTSKVWDKRLIHSCTLHSTVLEIYLACSATSSINRPSPHSNAHRQVPPVQSRILLFAYLSHRWWMLLNAYIKASKNLHQQDKELLITKIKHKQTLIVFFGECIIVFQAPAQFPKIKIVSNTDLY